MLSMLAEQLTVWLVVEVRWVSRTPQKCVRGAGDQAEKGEVNLEGLIRGQFGHLLDVVLPLENGSCSRSPVGLSQSYAF